MSEWTDAQEFERAWHGNACNSFAEETKQLTYTYKMGLVATSDWGHWPVYDLGGARILDMGGGPCSMLLKCVNHGPASMVVDPCNYPDWVRERYQAAGIGLQRMRGEDVTYQGQFHEAWLYNCLQHVADPALIVANIRAAAPLVRVFEWIDMPACEGHPQALTEEGLNSWFGVEGTTEWLNENGCQGRAWFGSFKT
jgi:hypothetical protein